MKLLSTAILLLTVAGALPAAEVDYDRDIRPLLHTKCSACHGALRQESGLRLDAGVLIHRGGDGGAVIDLANASDSSLLFRVQSGDIDQRMPPEGEGEPLTAHQIALLTAWIRAGAPYPESESIPAAPSEHWAYQRPIRPAVPVVKRGSETVTHPIDAFLLQRLGDEQLEAAPPADPAVQLRRVYLDLIGLPPTPGEQQAFLSDPSPAAWNQLVDRLLDDPAYGERWARHWMDVWRYSDWDGYKDELRGSQRHIWRWRDWIIESLNSDKPYDRMVEEMLAADELAPTDLDALRATGFLARNFHQSNRDIWLDATVEHTAKAFLAMTIDCARCHDHKFDPLAQKEYYALRAVFEPHNVRTERLPGEADLLKQGLVRAYDAQADAPTYLYRAGNEKLPDKEHPLDPGVPAILNLPYAPQKVELPPWAVYPALSDFIEQEDLEKARGKVAAAEEALAKLSDSDDEPSRERAQQDKIAAEAELASLEARWAADRAKYGQRAGDEQIEPLAKNAAAAEREAGLQRARYTLLVKQHALRSAEAAEGADDAKQKKIEAAAKELAEAEKQLAKAEQSASEAGAMNYTAVGKAYPAVSTGRRSALARWIVDPRNPLTARVAINHMWLRHFDQPLVENTFDFGLRSPRPEHAALLDWLAVEFMESGWSMKHIHRLIVTSAAYRRASSAAGEAWAVNRQRDPDNQLYWRASIQRLDAEVIRDSVLHVAGSLDRTMGGPDIDFADGEKSPRRSIYFRHANEKQMRMLVVFDAAAPGECYRRNESIVPQQALALANSTLVIEQARRLATKLSSTAGDDRTFIASAFEAVLCRTCSPTELSACESFLIAQTDALSHAEQLTPIASAAKTNLPAATAPRQRARENLVHVLLNHNDFITVR